VRELVKDNFTIRRQSLVVGSATPSEGRRSQWHTSIESGAPDGHGRTLGTSLDGDFSAVPSIISVDSISIVDENETATSPAAPSPPSGSAVPGGKPTANETAKDAVFEGTRGALEAARTFMFDARTSGDDTAEELVRQHWPVFVTLQALLCFGLYVVFRLIKGEATAGLDSLIKGKTLFVVNSDCNDFRLELWRSWTYQFSHASIVHIMVNTVMLIFVGLPLEGFHGHWRIAAIFSCGVVGGAIAHALALPHSLSLSGMSAGCYGLFAMHWGDLVINWRQSKFRRGKLMFMVLVVLMDVLSMQLGSSDHGGGPSTSYWSHGGGYVVGFAASVLLARNLKVKSHERAAQAVAICVLAIIVIFGIAWLAQWPPRSIVDSMPWCWIRQANNKTTFGDVQWHCIKCEDKACVERWSYEVSLVTVDHHLCPDMIRG